MVLQLLVLGCDGPPASPRAPDPPPPPKAAANAQTVAPAQALEVAPPEPVQGPCVDDASCGAEAVCVREPLVAPGGLGRCVSACVAHAGCGAGERCAVGVTHGPACLPAALEPPPETACHRRLRVAGAVFAPAPRPPEDLEGTGFTCAIDDPIVLAPRLGGVDYLHVGQTPKPLTLDCAMAEALLKMSAWLAARKIASVDHVGTYNCRAIASGERLSMHAHGMAIDVRGFRDVHGAPISVLKDWPQKESRPGRLLRDLSQYLHDKYIFNIVLTPEYNAAHKDHLHLDLTPGAHFLRPDEEGFYLGD